MANSLGTLTPGVVALQVLDFLKKKFPVFSQISTDFSGEAVNWNESVTSRVVTAPTVQDYDTTNGYVATDATATDVAVTINEHRHVTLGFNDQEVTGTNRNLVMEQMGAAAYSLGKDAMDKLLAVITTTNFTNESVEAVADVDRDTNIELRRVLRTRGAAGELYSLLNATAFANLSKDAEVSSRDYVNEFPDYDGGVIRNIGGIRNTFEYVDFPTTDNLIGFAGTRDSLVIAARVPKDPGVGQTSVSLPGDIEIVTDPDTGLSLMVRHWYDMKLGKRFMTLTWMFGVAKGVADKGQRLVSSATGS